MKKIDYYFRFTLVIFLLTILNACEESQPDDIYKQLEEKGKIATFPMNIVLTSNLAGDDFPEDLKQLASLSPGPCKTLPVAGILRLGPDQYYTYNSVSSLKLDPEKMDGQSIAATVLAQTNDYFSKTTLAEFDSLKAPIRSDLSSQILATDYIRASEDSVFFYSAAPGSSELTVMGGRTFPVYKDVASLRKKIDELICGKQATISVIYTPSPTAGIPGASVAQPVHGMYAGDTCVGGSKFEKLNDGKGNLFIGKLLEEKSKSCGFAYPTGFAGDTCVGKSRYQRLHNGRGGYTLGQLVEKNSTACGFTYPTGLAGDSCSNGSKYQKMHDGRGGFVLGNMIERNSRACGFRPIAVEKPAPVKTTPPPAIVMKSAPAANTVLKKETATPPPAGKTQPVITKPQPSNPVVNTQKQATARNFPPAPNPELSQAESKDAQAVETPVPAKPQEDKRCARTGDALCEQDATGNYTGRRVQYCYNSAGKIIRTIVLAKCDKDCRCF